MSRDSADTVLRVALPAPLRRLFDYLPPRSGDAKPAPGQRVRVPFGRRRLTGLLIETASGSDVPPHRLRRAHEIVDRDRFVPGELMSLLAWAWRYYQHPPGEVVATALPGPLRQGRTPPPSLPTGYRLTAAGRALDLDELKRAPRQREVVRCLGDGALTTGELDERCPRWRNALKPLLDRGLLEAAAPGAGPATAEPGPTLNEAQRDAVAAIRGAEGFAAFLLDGVAGSGKTEVYLNAIQPVLAAGHQALVIVPEIGLTPQLLARFRRRLGVDVASLHSGMADGERARAWLAARDGTAGVVVGTRSAIFTPLASPGMIIVDEEHDASLKQHEGFRYSARDLAVVRAQRLRVPVVLGSATPSMESLNNAMEGKYSHLRLPARAGGAKPPEVRLLDIRQRPLTEGLSDRLLDAMSAPLERGEQVLVFLNRRGFAPVVLCHDCGWHARCERCDAHLTLHRGRSRLLCHHCGAKRPVPERCPECQGDPVHFGAGTERLEAALAEQFPDRRVVRIDRDTTRRRGAFDELMDAARGGRAQILVGTQMLAKGHHLPDVTLVGVVDADQGLYSSDFRATERLAQLLVQVSGRAGRAAKPGTVLVQTHEPEHDLLNTLVGEGYAGFARRALAERRELGLPPFGYLALLRAEATSPGAAEAFLAAAREEAGRPREVDLWGPVPAPMEKRQGRFRWQLMLRSSNRAPLQRLLTRWLPVLEELPEGRRARWSIDVDPQDVL